MALHNKIGHRGGLAGSLLAQAAHGAEPVLRGFVLGILSMNEEGASQTRHGIGRRPA